MSWKPYPFQTASGENVEAEWGEFQVSENRNKTDSPNITLACVRFKSTNPQPGHPIVYLAGGPGGSGIDTARGARFPLFMALREVADVIAFDQRGTGASNPLPRCEALAYPPETPLTLTEMLAFETKNMEICKAFWQEQGVDLAAYNTWESAADLDALRLALGAEKINLWGISYGTHLALAAMKRMGEHIDRAVLASSEGPDQTIKLPGWSDAFFQRVNQAILQDPEAREKYPDFLGSMRRVLDRLEKQPATVTFTPSPSADPVKLTIGKEAIQLLTSFTLIKNPSNIQNLPATFAGLEAGHFEPLAQMIYYGFLVQPSRYSAMSLAMDAASGISPQRMETFRIQAKTALLGEMLNYPFPQLFGIFPVPDLGAEYRSSTDTQTPTLFLNGSLDGRTFPEETWEIMRGFSHATQITIENGGHDLFMLSPEVGQAVSDFFKNGQVTKTLIHIAPPHFQ